MLLHLLNPRPLISNRRQHFDTLLCSASAVLQQIHLLSSAPPYATFRVRVTRRRYAVVSTPSLCSSSPRYLRMKLLQRSKPEVSVHDVLGSGGRVVASMSLVVSTRGGARRDEGTADVSSGWTWLSSPCRLSLVVWSCPVAMFLPYLEFPPPFDPSLPSYWSLLPLLN